MPRGRVLGALGRFEAALEAYDRAQQLDPTRYAPTFGRGWIYFIAGRNADALKVADSLRAATMVGESWELACAAHVEEGTYELAVSACERSAANNDDWLTYASLAAAYAMRGDTDKATQAKVKLLAIAPAFTISRYEAKRYYITPEAVARDREHMIAGLRKAGLPE
jgi:tetratricopeptide (TPR) repeat protein